MEYQWQTQIFVIKNLCTYKVSFFPWITEDIILHKRHNAHACLFFCILFIISFAFQEFKISLLNKLMLIQEAVNAAFGALKPTAAGGDQINWLDSLRHESPSRGQMRVWRPEPLRPSMSWAPRRAAVSLKQHWDQFDVLVDDWKLAHATVVSIWIMTEGNFQ